MFSPAALAPRVDELASAIAERDASVVAVEVLGRELAALATLAEAMDQSLESDGIRGRGGEPRSLISLRMRLNDKLRRTLADYALAAQEEEGADPTGAVEQAEDARSPESVLTTVARLHMRPSIDAIRPGEFDPDQFLRAVITTPDTSVKTGARVRARAELTRRAKGRDDRCICSATLTARDEVELRDWIEEVKAAGSAPDPADAEKAAFVRNLARGERANFSPYVPTSRAKAALERAIAIAKAPAADTVETESPTREHDETIAPFWRLILSPDTAVSLKDRLDALVALAKEGIFPDCTCTPRDQVQGKARFDHENAWLISMLSQKHYRAATIIALFPETYLAVQDAIDEALLEPLLDSPR